jgi:hypothetical protein
MPNTLERVGSGSLPSRIASFTSKPVRPSIIRRTRSGSTQTQYAGLIILEVVTHLGIGRLALLVRHSLFLNLRIHSGAIHSVRKVGA